MCLVFISIFLLNFPILIIMLSLWFANYDLKTPSRFRLHHFINRSAMHSKANIVMKFDQ